MSLALEMLTKQKIKALPVQLIETKEGVLLKRGCTEMLIKGDEAPKIIKQIFDSTSDGGATSEDILNLFPEFETTSIEQFVENLLSWQMLVPVTPSEAAVCGDNKIESNLDVFYWHFDQTAGVAAEKINNYRIVILGVNHISRQLAVCLQASRVTNFNVVDVPLLRNRNLFHSAEYEVPQHWPAELSNPLQYEDWWAENGEQPPDCLIATSDFGNSPTLSEWNTYCVQHNVHFMPVVLHNVTGYIGPLVIPGETACFECVRTRQNSNMDNPALQRAGECMAFEGQAVAGFHPSMASALGDIAAFELTKLYGGILPSCNIGSMIEVNLLIPRMRVHKVLKMPRCLVCSPLITRPSIYNKVVIFAPRKKMTND